MRMRPAIAALALAAACGAAAAQDLDRGKTLWQQKANCAFCHGWAGDGQGDPRSAGAGTSLRKADYLDHDLVYQLIQCGRPGTGMPYHDRFAYKDDRCYGMTREQLGEEMPPFGVRTLQKHEIEALTQYVMAKIVDMGAVTREQCVEFFEGRGDCDRYQSAKGTDVFR